MLLSEWMMNVVCEKLWVRLLVPEDTVLKAFGGQVKTDPRLGRQPSLCEDTVNIRSLTWKLHFWRTWDSLSSLVTLEILDFWSTISHATFFWLVDLRVNNFEGLKGNNMGKVKLPLKWVFPFRFLYVGCSVYCHMAWPFVILVLRVDLSQTIFRSEILSSHFPLFHNLPKHKKF